VAELAQLADRRRLAALEVADEVPAERVAPALVLGREVLRAILADDVDAGVGEQGELVDRQVLRRDDDRDVFPDLVADALVALPNDVR
jgi:hypothetical protein